MQKQKRKGPAPNANQAQLRAAMRDGMDKTIEAMRSCEDAVNAAMESL